MGWGEWRQGGGDDEGIPGGVWWGVGSVHVDGSPQLPRPTDRLRRPDAVQPTCPVKWTGTKHRSYYPTGLTTYLLGHAVWVEPRVGSPQVRRDKHKGARAPSRPTWKTVER